MGSVDQTFVMDPDADLLFERDFTPWLAGETLTTVSWIIDVPDKLDQHDDFIDGTSAKVWLKGKGTEGVSKVTCVFRSSGGREDNRTWSIELKHR